MLRSTKLIILPSYWILSRPTGYCHVLPDILIKCTKPRGRLTCAPTLGHLITYQGGHGVCFCCRSRNSGIPPLLPVKQDRFYASFPSDAIVREQWERIRLIISNALLKSGLYALAMTVIKKHYD